MIGMPYWAPIGGMGRGVRGLGDALNCFCCATTGACTWGTEVGLAAPVMARCSWGCEGVCSDMGVPSEDLL